MAPAWPPGGPLDGRGPERPARRQQPLDGFGYRAPVELSELLRRRRMTRRFSPEPLDPGLLERLVHLALSAPSAGFSQGVELLLLVSDEARARFWELASEPSWRSSKQAEGILAAPAIVVPVADPDAYVRRYAEPDKSASGLAGLPASGWPVPYWLVDSAFVVMQLLLAAADAGLGALLFRLHAAESSVLGGLGVPEGRTTIGAVALGLPSPGAPARPHARRRPPEDLAHRDGW